MAQRPMSNLSVNGHSVGVRRCFARREGAYIPPRWRQLGHGHPRVSRLVPAGGLVPDEPSAQHEVEIEVIPGDRSQCTGTNFLAIIDIVP